MVNRMLNNWGSTVRVCKFSVYYVVRFYLTCQSLSCFLWRHGSGGEQDLCVEWTWWGELLLPQHWGIQHGHSDLECHDLYQPAIWPLPLWLCGHFTPCKAGITNWLCDNFIDSKTRMTNWLFDNFTAFKTGMTSWLCGHFIACKRVTTWLCCHLSACRTSMMRWYARKILSLTDVGWYTSFYGSMETSLL